MNYFVSINHQSDITDSTHAIPIIRIESHDINIHSLCILSGGDLYEPPNDDGFYLKDKVHIANERYRELISQYKKQKKTHHQHSVIEHIMLFLEYYILHYKSILKKETTQNSTGRSFNCFIITRRGKLLLGLAYAVNEMLFKLREYPACLGEAKWGTKAGLEYLIRKTKEHSNLSFDEMEYIEKEVTALLQGWEDE
ncbi:hypothetical protein [Yersinia pseudotuberculosis]|uniref:hypothetical protein n=1 Tax=Yersinia pseudotuberculosis TaxID=633 RepID=UPI000F6F38DD|nr:hypothetical protein [Yersinia pseudotuberculosis]VEE72848.1 Uncharacterised protein [Yersinia pseudotuberculosis]